MSRSLAALSRLISRLPVASSQLLVGLLAAAFFLLSAEASAQEIHVTGPLAGAPAPVLRRPLRQDRWFASAGLGEATGHHPTGALQLGYFSDDSLGVGLFASRALSLKHHEGPRIAWTVVPEFLLVPVTGKLFFFDNFFASTDLGLTAGAGLAGVTHGESTTPTGALVLGGWWRLFWSRAFATDLSYRATLARGTDHTLIASFAFFFDSAGAFSHCRWVDRHNTAGLLQ